MVNRLRLKGIIEGCYGGCGAVKTISVVEGRIEGFSGA